MNNKRKMKKKKKKNSVIDSHRCNFLSLRCQSDPIQENKTFPGLSNISILIQAIGYPHYGN
jgi:hypothetical protein